ncbi:hypothetical protein BS78_05G238500 [Paspalum vaginatum]|nr:hypothetical protein BS78_05G238500 [Paspalum vaginatum]
MVQLLQCSSSARMPSPRRPLFFPIVVFVLITITSSMEAVRSDARRVPLELSTTNKEQQEAATIIRGEKMQGRRRRALIGSRPPRCERACMSCGHCEAVQVPIVPQEAEQHLQNHNRATTAAAAGAGAAIMTYRPGGRHHQLQAAQLEMQVRRHDPRSMNSNIFRELAPRHGATAVS